MSIRYILGVSILYLLFTSTKLIAGDTPCNSTTLNTSLTTFSNYSNSGNSDSGIAAPPYGGYVGSDIWFNFTMPGSGLANLIIQEGSMTNPAIAIYEGTCTEPVLLYNILDNNCNSNLSPSAVLSNLTPGNTYYIRVWAENGSGDGTFALYLSETTTTKPKFTLHSDASPQGDCVRLTADVPGQQGCAWFELPIDFSQPFTHTMTANFGFKDIAGADGICLIYQSNGPDYCGASGGGIGAEGMPNSAIFEFDTWQNGSKNDPPEDHCAFNLNGNMDHNNSLNGPVLLPNIEDGLNHSITFVWDGSLNYELYFDGVLVLNGSYDFINNIFGGSNTAWWGYTSSTGASSNLQTICPEFDEYELGTQEHQKIELCEGESFNGYTDSGFYVDFTGGTGNCNHQTNTTIIVHPLPQPVYLNAAICEGFSYDIGGSLLNTAGQYPIYLTTDKGCDSLVVLTLEVIEANVGITSTSDIIDCTNDSLLLVSQITTNYSDAEISYNWSSNNLTHNEANWAIYKSGVYNLDVFVEYKEEICYFGASKDIYIDTISPSVIGLNDILIDCDTLNSIKSLSGSASTPMNNVSYLWHFNGTEVGTSPNQDLMGPGIYTLQLMDLINGCTDVDTSLVTLSDDRPKVNIVTDTLDCLTETFLIQIEKDTQQVTYNWAHNGSFFSTDKNPEISEGGLYELEVSNTKNCKTKTSVVIEVDTLKPTIILSDTIIPCNTPTIMLDQYAIESGFQYRWEGVNIQIDSLGYPTINAEGIYVVEVINQKNNCKTIDSIYVEDLGDSPKINAQNGKITCDTLKWNPKLQIDQSNVQIVWSLNNSELSTQQNFIIDRAGTYIIEATSNKGCSSVDSIIVTENLISPSISFKTPDTIDCEMRSIILETTVDQADLLAWEGPQMLTINSPNQSISQPGIYILTATNTENGCEQVDSIEVFSNVVISIYTVGVDTLNCSRPKIPLPFNITSDYKSLQWSGPNGFSSLEVQPEIEESGTYYLHIGVKGNCDIDTTLFIAKNFDVPTVEIQAPDITCRNTFSTVALNLDDLAVTWNWVTPSINTISNLDEFQLTESGMHYLEVIGKNGCSKTDTIEILAFLAKPESIINKESDLDCETTSTNLTSTSLTNDLVYTWVLPDGSLRQNASFSTSLSGIYMLEIENEYGCKNNYSIEVLSNTNPPEFELTHGTLDCSNDETFIASTIEAEIVDLYWTGPNNFNSSTLENTVILPGNYIFYAKNNFGCENQILYLYLKTLNIPSWNYFRQTP